MTEPITDLVNSIRSAVIGRSHGSVPDRVAAVLERFLVYPDLLTLEQRRPEDIRYKQHVLHVEPGELFSVVALVWLPGQCTRIHDHVAWGAVGVYQGVEREICYELDGPQPLEEYLVQSAIRENGPGAIAPLFCGRDIHKVFNPGPDLAISLHAYGTDIGRLGSSIRRFYDPGPILPGDWAI